MKAAMSDKPAISKKQRILDVAEELFSQRGFDGVTIRQVAQGAEVDVALANYHFGKKLDLFNAVFRRRWMQLRQSREEVLAPVDDSPQTLEQIIGAFLLPLKIAQQTGDPGWRNYTALAAYVMTSPVWCAELMPDTFDQQVSEFIEALKRVLPQASDEQIHWCYQYVSGALAITLAQTGRIDRLSGGSCESTDFDAAYEHMVPFIAAGFRAVCGPSADAG